MVRIKDKELSEQMKLNSKLTKEKAITKTMQPETVQKQQTFLTETKFASSSARVDRLYRIKGKNSKEDTKKEKKSSKPKNGKTPGPSCSKAD